MASKQEVLRDRVVSFYLMHEEKGAIFTVKHFKAEGKSERTIYNIISTYKKRLTTKRATGSGKFYHKMSSQKVQQLYRCVNHSDKYNISSAARKFNVSRPTIRHWLKKRNIRRYKKKKCPKYTEVQKEMVRRQCAWLYKHYRNVDFVLDDEKYFTLSHSINDSFMSSPTKSKTPESVEFKAKQKYEPKILLWIAISNRGISRPLLRRSGLAINQKVYENECLKKRLIPFLREYHSDNNYLFWPDKASSHYAGGPIKFLQQNNVKFMPKVLNPTNIPQCRPIEDFFGIMVDKVYKKGWKAENLQQLSNRIRNCLKKVDMNVVKRSINSIKKRLLKVGRKGPMAAVH